MDSESGIPLRNVGGDGGTRRDDRDSYHPDIAWSYRTPLPESEKIAGLVAFYNERADVLVDGVLQERPVTKFS
jgi:nucleotidyltransferase-like protein